MPRRQPWADSAWLPLRPRVQASALPGICVGCGHRKHYTALCPASLSAPAPILAGPMVLAVACRCKHGPALAVGGPA